jgi:hypothetical protein
LVYVLALHSAGDAATPRAYGRAANWMTCKSSANHRKKLSLLHPKGCQAVYGTAPCLTDHDKPKASALSVAMALRRRACCQHGTEHRYRFTCLPVSLLGVSSSHPQRSYDSSMRSARRTLCSMRAAWAPAGMGHSLVSVSINSTHPRKAQCAAKTNMRERTSTAVQQVS